MSRTVWPHAFQLVTGPLAEAQERGLAKRAVAEHFARDQQDRGGTPTALRWCVAPWLGLPRAPFEVFRRPRIGYKAESIAAATRVTSLREIEWGLAEMYIVVFSAEPAAGRTLVIDALDRRQEPIPGKRATVSSPQTILLRSPGIAALRVSGEGSLTGIRGIPQTTLANAPGWERIEVVGLPVHQGIITDGSYASATPQGPEPPSLHGLDAAVRRLQIAEILQLPAPATGTPDIPTPDFPAPDPVRFVKGLFEPQPGIMTMIQKCLSNTDDTSLSAQQATFLFETTIDGIQQADMPSSPGDAATAKLPVVGLTMIAVTGDSFAATGLGFGTVDFPPSGAREPVALSHVETTRMASASGLAGFDYMVTATFVMPFVGPVVVAALAADRLPPEAAVALTAEKKFTNRNPARDEPESESVSLSWRLSTGLQGWAVAVSRKPGLVEPLNQARRAEARGYDPFIPQRPADANGEPQPGARTTFVDAVSPVPLAGAATSRYLVAGLDVFGLWSPWRIVAHTAVAIPVQKPELGAVSITVDKSTAVGKVVRGVLTVDVGWDFTDRSPQVIELYGTFFPPSGVPNSTFTGGFLRGPTGLTAALQLVFDAGGSPSLVGGAASGATLEILASPPADPAAPAQPSAQTADVRRYRVTVANVFCDFSAATELAFAVTARGAERVRPAEWSAVVGPRPTRVFDPLPPAVPTLPLDLQWTALPDATRRARGVLRWPRSAGALGYVIWEAAEAALRHAIDPLAPSPAPGTSIVARATSLRAALAASGADVKSLSAFSRLNTELIADVPSQPTQSLEIELPGSAEGLFAFRVSAVSSTNEESERSSTVALFAVPHVVRPAQPQLVLRAATSGAKRGVKVFAIAGPGATPAGFRVHRVKNPALVDDVGLMGPAVYAHDAAAWQADALPALRGPAEACQSLFDEVATPSFAPLFYKLVAVGPENRASGEYRGESIASATQSIVVPPLSGPSLSGLTLASGSNHHVLRFDTNLPVRACPLGRATLDVLAEVLVGARAQRVRLASASADRVTESASPLVPLGTATAAQLAAMPEIRRQPVMTTGVASYSLRFPSVVVPAEGASPMTYDTLIVVVTDPLGRSAEQRFEVP